MFEKTERQGIIVYLYYNRDARKLAKYGDVLYHSRKMQDRKSTRLNSSHRRGLSRMPSSA